MKKLIDISGIFIIIAFILSIYCFSLAINLTYRDYKLVDEQNKFNKNLKLVSLSYNKEEKIFSEVIRKMQDNGVKNICSTPLENLIQEEDNFKATDVRFITKDLLNKYKTLIEDKNSLNEFNEQKKIAIVGQDLNDIVVNENGKEYIKVFDEQYEVVGKINKTDYLADTIFIPIESSMFYNRSYSSFTFFIADDEINTLKNILPKVYVEDIPEKSLIEAIINSPNVKDNILNLVLGIINLMLFSIFYCEKIKKKLAIMKVLGANNKHIFNDIIIMFFKFSSISFIIGTGLSYITTNLLNNYFENMLTSVNLTNILLTLVFMLITNILVSMFTLFNIIKFDVIKEIR